MCRILLLALDLQNMISRSCNDRKTNYCRKPNDLMNYAYSDFKRCAKGFMFMNTGSIQSSGFHINVMDGFLDKYTI